MDATTKQVTWTVELALRPGVFEAFRELTVEMVEASRAEAGTLIYERYLASDRRSVYLVERYADADAAVDHLRRFSDFFADRFTELVERRRVCVYGTVSAELRSRLDQLGAEYFERLAGFGC